MHGCHVHEQRGKHLHERLSGGARPRPAQRPGPLQHLPPLRQPRQPPEAVAQRCPHLAHLHEAMHHSAEGQVVGGEGGARGASVEWRFVRINQRFREEVHLFVRRCDGGVEGGVQPGSVQRHCAVQQRELLTQQVARAPVDCHCAVGEGLEQPAQRVCCGELLARGRYESVAEHEVDHCQMVLKSHSAHEGRAPRPLRMRPQRLAWPHELSSVVPPDGEGPLHRVEEHDRSVPFEGGAHCERAHPPHVELEGCSARHFPHRARPGHAVRHGARASRQVRADAAEGHVRERRVGQQRVGAAHHLFVVVERRGQHPIGQAAHQRAHVRVNRAILRINRIRRRRRHFRLCAIHAPAHAPAPAPGGGELGRVRRPPGPERPGRSRGAPAELRVLQRVEE
mmetsp:Transcript_3066/g.7624  ORF Transcript_3066/g.7624 Transcript_3066/m.7624 type:complete len:395 (+) Transcript_3066:458-1642(+)